MSLQTSYLTESPLLRLEIPFAVTPEADGDDLTIVISGELDIATAPLLKDVQRSVEGTFRTLRYDLGGLGFMDSAGLRALLAPASSEVPLSQISIIHPTRAVRRLLELRGLQGMIDEVSQHTSP